MNLHMKIKKKRSVLVCVDDINDNKIYLENVSV